MKIKKKLEKNIKLNKYKKRKERNITTIQKKIIKLTKKSKKNPSKRNDKKKGLNKNKNIPCRRYSQTIK